MAIDLTSLMPQQREIVTTLDRALFVSAGAGSGKTFTLTRRIVWALSPESGPFVDNLGQVLAITFTKDAAAEIRERVRGALIAEGMDEAALTVDDAWISTIHGMCSRLLRAHALELGLDPAFSVVEDTDELMERACDLVLAPVPDETGELIDARRRWPDLFSWFPVTGEIDPDGNEAGTSVHKIVKRLLEVASSLPHGMDDVHFVPGTVDFSGVADACRGIMADFGRSKAADACRAIVEAIDDFERGRRTHADVLALLARLELPRAAGKAAEAVKFLGAEAADAFVNALLATSGVLSELDEFARAVEQAYRDLKRERSALDNNDLLRLAYEALRDHDELRREYAGKFRMVMVDEFQDTDQQQVDLISYLTGPGERALCTVGDAQQSIYRFRGAEVEVFRRKERTVAERAEREGEGAGKIVRLVKNFRSHAEILGYVARVFDGATGGIMQNFLDLEPHEGRTDGLVAQGASRRQAIFVAGGDATARAAAKAQAIARRFRALADAGQDPGGMVLLLGKMSRAGVYADAFRDAGLDCVIAGGSVFAQTIEAKTVRALVYALANPQDTAQGLVPLLASPMFALGAEEFLALATAFDPETGESRRRNVDAGIMADDDAPGLEGLPLVGRARAVLRRAWRRVGADPLARIARDVVNESGWMVRLADAGPEGRAAAANVLKALDAIGEAEAELGRSPRRVALAFDQFLAGKQAPGALNEDGAGAVRIMTVHASKGLEFAVVAVAECFSVRANSERMQLRRAPGAAEVTLVPAQLPGALLPDGSYASGQDLMKRLDGLRRRLTPELAIDVCATGSAAGTFLDMVEEDADLELDEQARLLYVAMTRAREVLILAMDNAAGTSRSRVRKVEFNFDRDLTGFVLDRILPGGGADIASGRLVFEGSRPGDFEFIPLDEVVYRDQVFEPVAGEGTEGEGAEGEDAAGAVSVDEDAPDSFTLVEPAPVAYRVVAAPRPARDSFSYSSLARTLGKVAEDRAVDGEPAADADAVNAAAVPPEPAPGAAVEPAPVASEVFDIVAPTVEAVADEGDAAAATGTTAEGVQDDPTALGSAFHAAAQWLVETGAERVPAARRQAFARLWSVSERQMPRLEQALDRWESSRVRAEALAWPCVQAEVPFFTCGVTDVLPEGSHERYAEGAIDLMAYDPHDRSSALVIDYKTGGSPDETPEELERKHALQARVYAGVLHEAGFGRVTLKFVRVEIPDPAAPGEPEVVVYEL